MRHQCSYIIQRIQTGCHIFISQFCYSLQTGIWQPGIWLRAGKFSAIYILKFIWQSRWNILAEDSWLILMVVTALEMIIPDLESKFKGKKMLFMLNWLKELGLSFRALLLWILPGTEIQDALGHDSGNKPWNSLHAMCNTAKIPLLYNQYLFFLLAYWYSWWLVQTDSVK